MLHSENNMSPTTSLGSCLPSFLSSDDSADPVGQGNGIYQSFKHSDSYPSSWAMSAFLKCAFFSPLSATNSCWFIVAEVLKFGG